MNISGILVNTYPENITSIEQALATINGVEVHGNNTDGRIVITLEQDDTDDINETMAQIQDVPGVISAAMIYNQFEDSCDS